MEWVIALLAIGCIFFAIQVVVDFVKYKREIEPKIMRAQNYAFPGNERAAANENSCY